MAKRLDAQAEASAARLASIETGLANAVDRPVGRARRPARGVDSGAQAVSAIGEKLGGDVAGLGQELTAKIDASSAAGLAALESGLAGLRGLIPAAAPAAGGAAASPEAAAPAAAPADPGAPAEGYTAGETAILSDGALGSSSPASTTPRARRRSARTAST